MTEISSIDISLSNLWRAWRAFRRGKKPSRTILLFESELEYNLLRLCDDLNSGKYVHGDYDHKIINEKKRRDIAVASVRDRVVHRLLYDYLVPIVDPRLDYDVWSCRRGKGLDGALDRVVSLLHKYPNAWVWRADMTKFFDSVDQVVLRDCLRRMVHDRLTLKLLYQVIDSYCSGTKSRGIPIGNLTSQIFANIYLNEFDRFVRGHLNSLGYMRYGDDFIIIMPTNAKVLEISQTGRAWLSQALSMSINPKNDVVFKAKQGVMFLGHRIYMDGQVVIDHAMSRKIVGNIDDRNISSYLSMRLTDGQRSELPWRIIPVI